MKVFYTKDGQYQIDSIPAQSSYCFVKTLTIGNIEYALDQFGKIVDSYPSNEPEQYCCNEHRFVAIPFDELRKAVSICGKHKLKKKIVKEIACHLEDKLKFKPCCDCE